LLVASIRYGKVVALSAKGTASDFIDLAREGAWSALALAVDSARDRLWVTTEGLPHLARGSGPDSGRAAVLLYDLEKGTLRRRYELPQRGHELGDICLAASGDLYVSDGRAGAIYVVRNGSDSLRQLVSAGQFVSPQGCAIDDDGHQIFAADYALGVATVDAASGAVAWLPRSRYLAVNGIDGLILRGDRLIGVQNGVTPNRLIVMHLDRGHTAIGSTRVLVRDTSSIREPTHLARVDGDVVFVVNGGFGAFDEAGRRRVGMSLTAPRIGRLSLSPPSSAVFADTARTKRELFAADTLLAQRVATLGNTAFIAALDSNAAVLLPDQPILKGRAESEGPFRARYDSPARYVWRVVHAVASSDGRFGCTVGFSRFVPVGDSALQTQPGAYITCWRRDRSAEWRIVGHQRNDNRAQAATTLENEGLPSAPHSATARFSGNAMHETQDADAAFARLAEEPDGLGAAFASFAADDAVLLGAPTLPRGPAQIRETFKGFPHDQLLLWDPRRELGGGGGDGGGGGGGGGLAFTVGHSEIRQRGAASADSRSKYLTVWRQASDGRWEYIFDLGSPRAAQATKSE
jgi:ketosteroid isomerase-like protein